MVMEELSFWILYYSGQLALVASWLAASMPGGTLYIISDIFENGPDLHTLSYMSSDFMAKNTLFQAEYGYVFRKLSSLVFHAAI